MGNEISQQQQKEGTIVKEEGDQKKRGSEWISRWSGVSEEEANDNVSIEGRELRESNHSSDQEKNEKNDSISSQSSSETTITTRIEIMSGWLQKQTVIHLKPNQIVNGNNANNNISNNNNNNNEMEEDSKGMEIPNTNASSQSSYLSTSPFGGGLMTSLLNTVKTKSGIITNGQTAWQNRYFVLSGGMLYYYTSKTDETFKSVDSQIECKFPSSSPTRLPGINKVGYIFTVTWAQRIKSNLAPISLACPTLGEVNAWIQFFQSYSSNSEKSGWIYLLHNIYRKWSYRHIQIKNSTIEFSQRDERGTFPLTNASIEIPSNINSSTGFVFSVIDPTKIIHLSAETEEVRIKWMEAIDNEIQFLSSNNLYGATDRLSIELTNKVANILEKHKVIVELQQLEEEARKEDFKNQMNAPVNPKGKKTFILCIDGGGMRGIITTLLLGRIMKTFPDLLDRVDIVSGCSNGGMVAMAIAYGYDPNFCHMMLEVTGDTIFKTSYLSNSLNSAKYRNTHLKLVCDLIWKERKLKDAKKTLLIPAFLLDNEGKENRSCEPRVFHTFGDEHYEELASDVVMRTIAAPTIFPSYQKYVDGGLFAHDPSSQTLSFVLSPKRMNKCPNDVCLLSFGTGRVYRYYDDPNHHDWGYYQWLSRLPSCFWDGMLGNSSMICKEILGDQYFRLDPPLESEIAMDDPMVIPELTTIANEYDLSSVLSWIQNQIYS